MAHSFPHFSNGDVEIYLTDDGDMNKLLYTLPCSQYTLHGSELHSVSVG